jgi:hypothetical protein
MACAACGGGDVRPAHDGQGEQGRNAMNAEDLQVVMGIMEREDVEQVRHITAFAAVRKGKGITVEVMDSLVERSLSRYLVSVTDVAGHSHVGPARATAQEALTGFPWFKLD